MLGGITASMPGGSWLGALISGYLSDTLGRKKSIQIGSIIWYVHHYRPRGSQFDNLSGVSDPSSYARLRTLECLLLDVSLTGFLLGYAPPKYLFISRRSLRLRSAEDSLDVSNVSTTQASRCSLLTCLKGRSLGAF